MMEKWINPELVINGQWVCGIWHMLGILLLGHQKK